MSTLASNEVNGTPNEVAGWPARRSKLVVRALGERGPYVIKDPHKRTYYQLGLEEYFLLMQCNGRRAPEAICTAFEQHFEQPLSRSDLEGFLEMAQSRDLLADESSPKVQIDPSREQPDGRHGGSSAQPVAQSLLYWRKSLCDPDRPFGWLAPRLGFLWSRTFLLLSAGLILMAVGVFWSSRYQLADDVARLLTLQTAAWAWLVLAIVAALHESAHGLTCKRYGGEVHELGFLLIYFQPAFYCNVSDAWLLPRKSQRLWVTFAGAYCELLLWGVATVTWRVTEPGSGPNYFALVMMGLTGMTSLLNLNPLIKLDGYYLLSDYLEVPNLRGRAFRYLRSRFKSARPSGLEGMNPTARERRIFWIYGLLAGFYSFWLLAIVIIGFATLMTGRFQGWGLVFFAALLAYVFRNPFRRSLRSLASGVRRARAMPLLRRLVRILMLVAPIAAVLFLVHVPLKISGEFSILPVQKVDVRAEVEGFIEEIPKEEGELVQAGERVARLSDRDYRADLQKIEAELEEKDARLRLLKAGARAEEIELAKTTITKAEQRLQYSRTYLAMERNLFDARLTSRKDLEVAAELVSVREKELEEALGHLKVILAGSRPEEIEATQAEIHRLSAQRSYLKEQCGRLQVLSPITGFITTRRLKQKMGENVRKGDLIATVHDFKTVTAEISVPEKEIAEVKLGQRVMLKARSFSQIDFEGRVLSIAPMATNLNNGMNERMVLVQTRLDNPDLLLKPEMSGHAKIYCGERRMIELVSRRLLRYLRVEFWSWW
jgi:multidrug resistance efflux pump